MLHYSSFWYIRQEETWAVQTSWVCFFRGLVSHHLAPSVTVTILICAASMLEMKWKDGLWFWFPGFWFFRGGRGLFHSFILFQCLIKLSNAWSEADLDSNSTCYCLFYSCSAPDGRALPPQWALESQNNSREDSGMIQVKQFFDDQLHFGEKRALIQLLQLLSCEYNIRQAFLPLLKKKRSFWRKQNIWRSGFKLIFCTCWHFILIKRVVN